MEIKASIDFLHLALKRYLKSMENVFLKCVVTFCVPCNFGSALSYLCSHVR